MDPDTLRRTTRVYALLALTPLVPWLGAMPYGAWIWPWLVPLTLFGAFTARVRLKDYLGAWRLGLVWAALLSVGVITLVLLAPEVAREGILNGESYRQEMFHWIATGEGREASPARFLPQHALHLGVFVVLAWISAGYLGLVLGAVLVGYMSYFVGSYAVAAGSPVLGPVVAWVPWSVLRVLAFVLLGTLFARPLLVRRPWPFGRREYLLLAMAATGILGDVLIKTFLAEGYGQALRSFAGGAGSALGGG